MPPVRGHRYPWRQDLRLLVQVARWPVIAVDTPRLGIEVLRLRTYGLLDGDGSLFPHILASPSR